MPNGISTIYGMTKTLKEGFPNGSSTIKNLTTTSEAGMPNGSSTRDSQNKHEWDLTNGSSTI